MRRRSAIFVSWLKFGGVESPVRAHPETVSKVLGYGYSQSGRFLRDFLYRGFNADETGRQVFDGLFIASAGAGRGSFDHRYAMPGMAGNSVLSDLRPVDLFPFSDEMEEDSVTGARDGLLREAEASHTLPRIVYTYSSTEYWARAGSLAYTSVDGARELQLNDNARLYFFAGTPHASYPFPPIKGGRAGTYENYANFARADWLFRAVLLDLDAWVTKGTTPPDSAYPHAGADLVSRDHVGFPTVFRASGFRLICRVTGESIMARSLRAKGLLRMNRLRWGSCIRCWFRARIAMATIPRKFPLPECGDSVGHVYRLELSYCR